MNILIWNPITSFDPNKVDDDLKDIPPELLSGLRQAKNLPPEIRKSVIDFIRFQNR